MTEGDYFHERSHNENCTPSRPLWEVKSHLARSVVRRVTTCEARVLFVLLLLPLHIPIILIVFLFYTSSSFLISLILILSRVILQKLNWIWRESNPWPWFTNLSFRIFWRIIENLHRGCSVGHGFVWSIRREPVETWERKWNPSKSKP